MVMMSLSTQFPTLKNCRAHEVCGPGALPFALAMAARVAGAVMFVDALHERDQIYPFGAGRFVDMARVLSVRGTSQDDILWIAEEALRSGCVPVVIAHITKEISLTAGRRLQLAAEVGKSLGLFIVPEGMGSNAAETRWYCQAVRAQATAQLDSTLFQWTCNKNKTGTTGSWMVRWNETTRHIDCLSKAGDRSLSQAAAS